MLRRLRIQATEGEAAGGEAVGGEAKGRGDLLLKHAVMVELELELKHEIVVKLEVEHVVVEHLVVYYYINK